MDITAKGFGNMLIEAGYKILAGAFNLKPQIVPYDDLVKWSAYKMPNNIALVSMDYKLHLIDWTTWKDIIASDWTSTKKYAEDAFDCDNFAITFAAHCSELYNVTVAYVYGKAYKPDGTYIDMHYWNAMFTKEIDGSFHIYFFEPMNGTYGEYPGQGKFQFGTMIYEPKIITIF